MCWKNKKCAGKQQWQMWKCKCVMALRYMWWKKCEMCWKRQCIKHAQEMKWILQVCMKGKHKSVPTKQLKMKMNNMKWKNLEWLQCKNAKCGNIMKVCEEYYKPIVIRTLWQKE